MKKIFSIFIVLLFFNLGHSQEILANVQVNAQQLGGSNQQVFRALEKNLRDFINNTSWSGRKLQNFEKIKSNFTIQLSERNGNIYKGSIVVQAVRPVFNSTYESPLLNINDTKFAFEYVENENLVFNERQFSGKNLIDVLSYYVFVIMGYDADSFQNASGTKYFNTALQIAQNSQNKGYEGWAQSEGPRTRISLIQTLLNPNMNQLRSTYYAYHRAGLDNLSNTDQSQAKKTIFDALMQLKRFESNFVTNYALNVFIDTKQDEIYNIFSSGNNTAYNIGDLKQLMIAFAPKFTENKWNKWK